MNDPADTTTLFRPVRSAELQLIIDSADRAFPPRLPDQPLFYSVMNEEYAVRIARDWNVKDSGSGFVTRFQMPSRYLARYPVQRVGSSLHLELWVPAEDLAAFNSQIIGSIEIVREFCRSGETTIEVFRDS